jgi:hypothetical protein
VNILFLAMIYLGTSAASAMPGPTSPSADPATHSVGLGSCRGADGFLELRRIALLENRALDFRDSGKIFRVTVDGPKVRIEQLASREDHGIYVVNLENILKGNPDIALTLGLLDDRPVVYWRETFVNRSHRQGIFKIKGQSLVPLCEGKGGVDILD